MKLTSILRRNRLLIVLLLVGLTGSWRVARANLPMYVQLYDGNGDLIVGPVAVKGLEKTHEGIAFIQKWAAATDAATGQITGQARPIKLEVTFPVGPATPILTNALIKNSTLKKVVFHLYRIGPVGTLEEFYRITTTNVHVVDLRTTLRDVLDPESAAYDIEVTVGLVFAAENQQTYPFTVQQILYLAGDTNGDLKIDISDPVLLLGYLFLGSMVRCPLAGDSNGDGQLDLSDAIGLLSYLFQNGKPPPAPFPSCGEPPPGAAIPCDQPACGAGQP